MRLLYYLKLFSKSLEFKTISAIYVIVLVLFICNFAHTETLKPLDYTEITADDIHVIYENDKPSTASAEGNVFIKFQKMTISAQSAKVDFKTNVAILENGVKYSMQGQQGTGNKIQLNIKTGKWELWDSNSLIEPSKTEGFLLEPVYIRGKNIEGNKNREIFSGDTELTTCNLPHPHYNLHSRKIEIYPGDKIVFRSVSLTVLDKKLITIPRIIVPINESYSNSRLIPRIGQSVAEGIYIKTAYSYTESPKQAGFLTFDLMSNKGIGTGINHSYNTNKYNGGLNLYLLKDRNIGEDTFTGTFEHSQKIGEYKANISSDFRTNSYLYAPQSKSLLNQIRLSGKGSTSDSSISISQSINDTYTKTIQNNGTLVYKNSFANNWLWDSMFDYASYDTSNFNSAKLTSNVKIFNKQKEFDWSISALELTDLSDERFIGTGYFAGIEKLPELSFFSDTARLGAPNLPLRLQASYGNFVEMPSNTNLDRTFFDVSTPTLRYKMTDTWSLATGMGFKQYFYSDDTAQYLISTNAEIKKQLGKRSSFGFIYRFQRPRGYTPFRFDYIGRYNDLNARLQIQETSKFKLSLLSGYNFEQRTFPWQDITLRMSIQPLESFLFYTATGYDLNRGQLRTLINQIRIRDKDNFKLDIGSRYDTINNRWASIKTQLDMKVDSKMRFQALAGYDGFTKTFDYRSFMITRDLHCWETSLIYQNQSGFYKDESIMLNFRIKAFPTYQSFGMGAYGQALDTSVGEVY